jgi:signal transduction histidine kinase
MVAQQTSAAAAAGEAARLVLSICHETANWVSAIRMSAHLLDHELSPIDLANSALEIDDLSARVGGMLGLVRPLLDEQTTAGGASPANVMAGVRDVLEARGGRGVKLSVASGDGLPEVAAQPDTLHLLIVSLACYALDEAQPRDAVAIRSEPAAGSVVFIVEDTGPEDSELRRWQSAPLRGRVLCCALASCLLDRLGGRVDVTRVGKATRVALVVPTR